VRDLRQILDRLRALDRDGGEAWLATIARVEGSSYRREGTRLLVERGGRLTGVLSGGCLERDIAALAEATTAPRAVLYDLTADEEAIWGMGSGCSGRVTLLLEPLDAGRRAAEIGILETVLEARRELRVARVFELPAAEREVEARVGDRIVLSIEGGGPSTASPSGSFSFYGAFSSSPFSSSTSPAVASAALERELRALAGGEARAAVVGGVSVLLESILPPVHLVIVGSERDAPALARAGHALGWKVTAVDLHGPADAAAARFAGGGDYVAVAARDLAGAVELSPRTAVVIATHRYLDDLAVLGELRAAPLGHLALLGPARRRERLLADLDRIFPGSASAMWARLRGPAGLDLGGRAPEEVALAVVAEIQAAFSGRDARPLSERARAEPSALRS
jgi:xanthine/CO dehydrogenase XdhC/CoxF family maturation factor